MPPMPAPMMSARGMGDRSVTRQSIPHFGADANCVRPDLPVTPVLPLCERYDVEVLLDGPDTRQRAGLIAVMVPIDACISSQFAHFPIRVLWLMGPSAKATGRSEAPLFFVTTPITQRGVAKH